MSVARLVVAPLVIGLLGELVASTAVAQPIDAYRTAVFTPDPPYYTDPRLTSEAARTPELSYPRLTGEIERIVHDDVRFEWVAPETLEEHASADRIVLQELGDARRLSGIANFGRYELQSAIDLLSLALRDYSNAGAYLTDPADVAQTHEYLARAYLEQANTNPGDRLRLVTLARDHFRDMIRLNPVPPIREGVFPSDVVQLYQEVYLELLSDAGRALSLSEDRAAVLAERYDLDRVAWVFFLRGQDDLRIVIEVHDREGRVESRQVVAIEARTADSIERVSRAVSRYLACVPVRYEPPPVGAPGDAGRFFLQAGWGAGVYGEKPTQEQFLNQGVGFTLDYHVTDYFGFFGRANVMFGTRDAQGDLLSGFTSTRLSGGIALSVRAGWFRPFLGLGAELNVVGGFTASEDFWCKVTGGEFVTFGLGRDCLPDDVQVQSASVLFGPYLMPGAAFDIVGPFGAYVLGSFAFYISDARTNVDFPLAGEAGIEYRF